MNYCNKILYLCDLFEKKAQALNVQKYNFEYGEKELNKVKNLLLFLVGKNIPIEEIDYWLSQNEDTLIDYKLSINYIVPDHHLHALKTMSRLNNKLTYSFISMSNDLADDIEYDIIKHGFLKGYKNIPNLFIFMATESGLNRMPLSKDLSPYGFLEKALIQIGTSPIDDEGSTDLNKNESIVLFPQFLNENKSKIDKLMSSFSYSPKYLGGGYDGAVFDVGQNLTLKIFRDSFSYYKAKESYDRLHKNPELAKNEAMIYDVGILGPFGKQTIYYYIMEKMKPIENDLKPLMTKIVGYIGEYIRYERDVIEPYRKLTHDHKNNEKIRAFLNNHSSKLESLLYNEHAKEIYNMETFESDLKQGWVKSLCEEILFKYLTGRGDLHLGNLGLTNYGRFVYFDPSFSGWENDNRMVNTPSRDSINYMDNHNESEMFI
jgi:hypothetical protein